MFGRDNISETGTTLIATNCELVGDIHFGDHLLINGTVKGNIFAQEGSNATVTIGETGQVTGQINVPNIIVNGSILGELHSERHIELAAKADVKGNVFYNLMEMVMGSRVVGNLMYQKDIMDDSKDGARTPKPEISGTESQNIGKISQVAVIKTATELKNPVCNCI